jgi:hypothetical protein
MVRLPPAGHAAPVMSIRSGIQLCDYDDAGGRRRLSAVVDELTLTYDVVARGRGGHPVVLRRHLLSLRVARSWALAYCDAAVRVSHQPSSPDAAGAAPREPGGAL